MPATPDAPVTLSVLDRLIDLDPARSEEAPLTRLPSVRALRAAVRRDLEWLLNTRRVAVEPDESLIELRRSLYQIGVMDFSGFSLSTLQDQSRLLHHLQEVIQQFEPRLAQVRITPHQDPAKTRAVRFRIEASLIMDPSPERVSFDTVLQLASGAYQVREES